MKSMNDENSRSNNNGWLGFSLSPHPLTMEASSASHHHHHHHQNQAIPSSNTNHNPSSATSFFNTQGLLNYTNNSAGLYYGVDQGENGGSQHFSMLPVMPLKSDGTLCIMQGMLPTSSTPKLEDFFGGETMGPHHYENHDREAMALGMDNMFYHHEPSSQGFTHPCYTAFKGNELVMHTKEQQQQAAIQVSAMAEPHGISGTWTQRGGGGYSLSRQVLEQKMTDFMGQNGEHSGHIGSVGYGDLQSLSLSMSPSSQSSCVTASQHISPTGNECLVMESRKRLPENVDNQRQIVHRKSLDTFGQRTSQYRGVTRHRWTGRYEAHLWDNSCKKEGQSRKGRQVYLGGYDSEEKAARAYDQAALKYWGSSTHINFPLENYQQELEDMKNLTRQEYVAHLRRNSSGFSRGASIYRGVTRHHQHGRWQARIGRVAGNKDLYLGTFSTQEEAAEAYDIAAIKFRGINAVTNFDIARYDVEKIMASNTLLASDLARRNKEIQSGREARNQSPSVNISSGGDNELGKNDDNESDSWKMIFYQSTQPQNSGCGEQLDQNRITVGNDKVLSLPMAEKGLAKIDRMTSIDQQQMNDSDKIGTHVSDPSSLVTSLGSSREGSPDKANLALPFTMPPSASWLFTNTAGAVTTWLPSVQLRHGAAMAQMPLFAAWADS